ncbi:MAG TPA: PA0069 family radical SAM protein [Candidatus Sulfotelmatobacter sp.]|jgi:DNA repair photolyase|nr:PA0069 family radical SAM protein [Candidatus Sulfotelmatobacter sp.]
MRPGPEPPKGRGSPVNPAGRFEPRSFEPVWDDLESARDEGLAGGVGPATELFVDTARTILTTNDSPDVPFDVSINPYRGCEHGCAYCFARPSHAYLNLSPGLDFETKIFFKPDAPRLLERELAKPGYVCKPIALGTNTDPYQPAERRLRLTRRILEILSSREHPFGIVTKSALVLRDIDLIGPAAARTQANVMVSITTLDPALAGCLEPRAASPGRRLETLRALSAAGIPCGVLASPMIPGLNDHELERILEASREAGATIAGFILVRLPHEVKEVFTAWLTTNVPNRKEKVLSAIRSTRGGALYDPRFGARMRGEGPYAEILARRFAVATKRLGFARERFALDTSRFRPVAADSSPRGLFR